MWEDFVRGNWPAAASAMPESAQLPSAKTAGGPARAERPVPAPVYTQTVSYAQGYPRAASYAPAASYAQAVDPALAASYAPAASQARDQAQRPATGKLAFRAALAAGAGLVLAIVVPSSAVAGAHTAGSHTVGAHAAAHTGH